MAFFFSKEKATPIDRQRSLDSVPVVNEGVTCTENERGHINLDLKLRPRPGWFTRFQGKYLQRNIQLDELGTFIFRQIDNKRSVLQIVNNFIDRYRLNRREAMLSTVEFLKSLMKKGAISIAIK